MNTLVPTLYYSLFFNIVLLCFMLVVLSKSYSVALEDSGNLAAKKNLGFIILIFLIFFLGLRPISFAFGDMANYAIDYNHYRDGSPLIQNKDFLFEKFMQISSHYYSASLFFFICVLLYVLPLYYFSRSVFKDYWFYSFFILVISFSFYTYGVNGIRNGIASSIFLLGVSKKRKISVLLWFLLAISIHKSLLIPSIAYGLTFFYKDYKKYLFVWIICIPLSLVLGNYFQNFFLSIGLIDQQRAIGYLSGDQKYLDQLEGVRVGFRWDFLLYSASGIIAGWYYIVKKKFEDVFYTQLFCMYTAANAIWVLVIRSNFSNRIAYLSWFMLGVIIIYPLLRNKLFAEQHKVIGKILFVYFAFTFFMNVLLAK